MLNYIGKQLLLFLCLAYCKQIFLFICFLGFTPLILAATAGHVGVVEILLDNGADIEAQSERTKDTPLSLACSGGRQEVLFPLSAISFLFSKYESTHVFVFHIETFCLL